MKELSLYILDITMNSVRANAQNISILIDETGDTLDLEINDDGCGMTEEQVESLSNPFFTTRTTRKVGLGVPFLKMAAEMTGGYVEITSKSEREYKDHGTRVKARFYKNHIDFTPLGDMIESVITLIQGSPEINFLFRHKKDGCTVELDTAEIREILGDEVPLSNFEVLAWMRENLKEQYENN